MSPKQQRPVPESWMMRGTGLTKGKIPMSIRNDKSLFDIAPRVNTFDFSGHKIVSLSVQGQACFVVSQVAGALGEGPLPVPFMGYT